MAALSDVKLALRITTDVFDDEITRLMASAETDLGIAGVDLPDRRDDICNTAIITYCKMMFGEPSEYERLKRSYDEQKAQLVTATGYTTWTEATS